MAKVTGVGRNGVAWSRTGGTMTKGGGMTPFNWRIQGIEEVTAGINAALMEIQTRSAEGLKNAAHFVLKDADDGMAPKVPEDTGKLRDSTFVKKRKKASGDPYVQLGYNTNYAAAVHEMMQSASGNPINWQRPDSGPKFLESALKRNTAKILQIVKAANT